MKFTVITLFPEMVESVCSDGVLGQAIKKGLVTLSCIQPRKFTSDNHKTVDDRPFGGGDGMVMLAEPLEQSILQAQQQAGPSAKVIYLSPQGQVLNQNRVQSLSHEADLILICGRYSGIDQRIINQYVDEEISIGDFVISGGELAAAVLIDAVSRQIPGVLGHLDSASADSFSPHMRGVLECPQFTRPREFNSQQVPEMLLSGHHQKIARWKEAVSVLVTLKKRPELLESVVISDSQKNEFVQIWNSLTEAEKKVLGISELQMVDFDRLSGARF